MFCVSRGAQTSAWGGSTQSCDIRLHGCEIQTIFQYETVTQWAHWTKCCLCVHMGKKSTFFCQFFVYKHLSALVSCDISYNVVREQEQSTGTLQLWSAFWKKQTLSAFWVNFQESDHWGSCSEQMIAYGLITPTVWYQAHLPAVWKHIFELKELFPKIQK